MAFAAIIAATGAVLIAFPALAFSGTLGPLAAFVVSVLIGQVAFALVVIKALICRSLRRSGRRSHPLRSTGAGWDDHRPEAPATHI